MRPGRPGAGARRPCGAVPALAWAGLAPQPARLPMAPCNEGRDAEDRRLTRAHATQPRLAALGPRCRVRRTPCALPRAGPKLVAAIRGSVAAFAPRFCPNRAGILRPRPSSPFWPRSDGPDASAASCCGEPASTSPAGRAGLEQRAGVPACAHRGLPGPCAAARPWRHCREMGRGERQSCRVQGSPNRGAGRQAVEGGQRSRRDAPSIEQGGMARRQEGRHARRRPRAGLGSASAGSLAASAQHAARGCDRLCGRPRAQCF